MNGGESEKKGEEGLEICETGENILPQNTKSLFDKTPENENDENEWQSSKRRNKTKMKQITNKEVNVPTK